MGENDNSDGDSSDSDSCYDDSVDGDSGDGNGDGEGYKGYKDILQFIVIFCLDQLMLLC